MIRVGLNVESPAMLAGLRSLLSVDAEIDIVEAAEDTAPLDGVDVIVTTAAPSTFAAEGVDPGTWPAAMLFLSAGPLDAAPLGRASHAWGMLPFEASSAEICAAIRALSAGLIVSSRLLSSAPAHLAAARGPLTDRETEILGLLARGMANKQIALELGISEHTVKFHVSSIYTKLDASSRTQAVREGLRSGLIVL